MANVQRGVNQPADTQEYQILDFQETLQKCIEDEQKIYGRKNKPRQEEPSMFQILTWKDGEEEIWNYTKKNKELIDTNLSSKLKYKINKSLSHWTTENMDQYRKFAYSPSKKPVFFDLEDPASTRGKVVTQGENFISKDLVEQLTKSAQNFHPHSKEIPKHPSEFIDKYTIQDLNSLPDVLKVLQNRALTKGGEVVRNPIAQQVSEAIEKEQRRTAHHGGHEGYYEEGEGEEGQEGERHEDQESEDVQVEKMDLTNVKSRLLEKKVKSAKILDPVYEKDRLNRRKERIKKLNETTRWLPNSAFKTYFGKAPFENYGRGNVNPTVGGSIYGDYLKSHNINPHSGGNKPEYQQVYNHADFAATRYPDSVPEPPRKCKDDFRLSQKQVEELKRRNPLVADKFTDKPKNIVKPDLVNTLRFASEENTPDNSFEEKPKTKNLRESLKNLNKKARAIRKETAKHTESLKQRTRSETRKNAQESPQQTFAFEESIKSSSAKKPSKDTQRPSEKEQTKPKQKVVAEQQQHQPVAQEKSKKSTQKQQVVEEQPERSYVSEQKRPKTATVRVQQQEEPQQTPERKVFNASEGVKNLMKDPASSFQENIPQTNKVTFKEAPQFRASLKVKETPVQQVQRPQTAQIEFGKVEELPTLLKELQKNEKLREKINEDMGGALDVDPLHPPKNYLFSLSQKETDPRYYKNVPAVWLQRIPYAGKNSGQHEDVKQIFNYWD